MSERFEHRPFSQSIKDNLTGYLHSDLKDITDLLNDVNDKSKRIETVNESYLETILKLEKIMKKYGISSVEELDHILFYARVW